jgi:Zn-dependent M28 family amino/carboxypeptidase
LTFSGQLAWRHVESQVALGPRTPGSAANRQLGDQVLAHLAAHGWQTATQEFTYNGTPLRNLVGVKGAGEPIVILGAHYDTRPRADRDSLQPDQPVPGANDGGSGVAVLMELARALEFDKIDGQVWLAFFDAEDSGELDGWEWIVGSRVFAENLAVTPGAVVIVDMVGDAQQAFYLESNSDQGLLREIWDVAARLGYGEHFVAQPKWAMLDDHTPFLQRGLRAADIIDFDYPFWHTVQDTPDKVVPDSLERVGRTLEAWLEK